MKGNTLHFDVSNQVLFLSGSAEDYIPIRTWLRSMGGKWDGSRWIFPAVAPLIDELRASNRFNPPLVMSVDCSNWLSLERERQQFLSDERGGAPWCGPMRTHKVRPFCHQSSGADFLGRFDRALLLDEMGLGKTKTTIDAVSDLSMRWKIPTNIAVVVCPNTVKRVWKEEILKNSDVDCRVLIPSGSTKERAEIISQFSAAITKELTWIILNYEALRYFETEFLGAAFQSVLVCDEIHRLKNDRAKVTGIIRNARPARFYGLSGTLVANEPLDAWSIANLMRPGILGWSFYEFDHRHVMRNKFGAPYRYKDLDRIARRLSIFSLGRRKSECLELPPITFEKRYVTLSAEESRAYRDMREKMIAWMDEQEIEEGKVPTLAQAAQFSAQFVRLRQIIDGFVSEGSDGAQSWSQARTKMRECIDVWEDAGRPPIVVWCQWVPAIRELQKLWPSSGTAHVIYGGVPEEQRARNIAAWNRSENGALICQMDTAGEGVNLQHASLEVFLDLPTTPKQRRQCSERLHRIGQGSAVTVIDLIAQDTVDEKILRNLERKLRWAQDIDEPSFRATGGVIKSPRVWLEMLDAKESIDSYAAAR